MDEPIHHPRHIFSPIQKKRHPKSYHSDIKYHMILTIIFRVVTNDPVELENSGKFTEHFRGVLRIENIPQIVRENPQRCQTVTGRTWKSPGS